MNLVEEGERATEMLKGKVVGLVTQNRKSS